LKFKAKGGVYGVKSSGIILRHGGEGGTELGTKVEGKGAQR